MKKLTIGVVFGGRSGEHEVSKLSAANIIKALESAGYSIVRIFIDKNGRWSVDNRLVSLSPSPGVGLRYDENLKEIAIDVYFPAMHGTYGEDGTIQGLFEMAGVPYVGAGVLGSSIGMDKEAQKQLFLFHGIPTPHFEVLHIGEWEKDPETCIRHLKERVGFPCFVKPANLGSSVAVNKAKNEKELKKYIREAFQYDVKILVEEFIKAREVDCAVIGPNENPRVSLPAEVVPKREFYDYLAKYVAENTEYKFALPLPEHLKDKLMATAARVYQITFCEGMARVEFLLTKSEDIFVMEINTIPGSTSHSLFPRLWEASSIPFSEVVKIVVELALDRWRRKQALKTEAVEGKLLDTEHHRGVES